MAEGNGVPGGMRKLASFTNLVAVEDEETGWVYLGFDPNERPTEEKPNRVSTSNGFRDLYTDKSGDVRISVNVTGAAS